MSLDPSIPDVVGVPPDIEGKVCNALICEQFVKNDNLVSLANVIYIQANTAWYRLFLDSGVIHWRESKELPEPYEIPEEGWAYPHIDLAEISGLVGQEFAGYCMTASSSGCRVEFLFVNDRRIVFDEVCDSVRYEVF